MTYVTLLVWSGPNTEKSKFADATPGGFQFGPTTNHITFREGYLRCGIFCRTAIIVHECAHYVGGFSVFNNKSIGQIDHFAREFPIPQGSRRIGGLKAGRNYQQLDTDEALRNASSYAAYAIHAATGVGSPFGLNNRFV